MMISEISGDLLQWLRGFYFVAEKGSVRQAAIAMGRERPTISRQIHCLEKELGVTLFDRSSGKMMITPEGKILQEGATMLFEYLQQIKGELTNEDLDYRGKISITATPAVIHNILPPYLSRFRGLHPEVTFQFEGGTRERVYEGVESAEMDFGIATFEAGHKTLLCHDLYEADRIMIAPKHNRFFPGRALPTIKQIAEAPLLLIAHRGLLSPLIERQFAEYHLKPNTIMSHNNFLTIKKWVAQGMGVAILDSDAIVPEDAKTFDIYNLAPYFPKRKYGIILKKNKYLPPMVKAFIRIIKPGIDFAANPEASASPVLSLREFLLGQERLKEAEVLMVRKSRG